MTSSMDRRRLVSTFMATFNLTACSSPSSYTGSFQPLPAALDTNSSPLHSTFDRLNTPSLASTHSTDEDAQKAVETLEAQLAMYGVEPLAFAYPPLDPLAGAA